MIFFEYLIIAVAIGLCVLLIWTICMLGLDIYFTNRIGYLMNQRKQAEHQKDYDRLASVNDKIGSTARLLHRLERIAYFDFY